MGAIAVTAFIVAGWNGGGRTGRAEVEVDAESAIGIAHGRGWRAIEVRGLYLLGNAFGRASAGST